MTDEVNLDIERESRTGLSEAVFSEGKSDTQLLDICDALKTHNKDMLFTRLTPPQFNLIDEAHPGFLSYDPVSRTASNLRTANAERSNRNNAPIVSPASVAIVSGGSSDVPIASEAKKNTRILRCEFFDDQRCWRGWTLAADRETSRYSKS